MTWQSFTDKVSWDGSWSRESTVGLLFMIGLFFVGLGLYQLLNKSRTIEKKEEPKDGP